ncbi:hypothetical protein GRAN_0058 [Granulicella sibirica]|uniref:Uncharacterized protein n=1 Tax=Granulicella sibirica TaxID=2479048 RepID=A0A4Q0T3Y9_9BACT|nr:hypothetical protein GRAN_0058 [Granulicella sibirica]
MGGLRHPRWHGFCPGERHRRQESGTEGKENEESGEALLDLPVVLIAHIVLARGA